MNTDKKIQMNTTDKKIQMNTDKGQALRRSLSRAKSSCSGQAAIELAIFGSLILLALGVFVRYGLNVNYSQKIKMDAYGKARAEMNSEAESTIYVVLRDKPMPNPSNPFGVTSRDSVFFASETVGRLKGVFDTPEYPSDSVGLLADPQLPRLIYDINGIVYKFTAAAFKYHPYNNQELKRKAYKDGKWYWKTSGPGRTDSNGVRYEQDKSMDADGDFWEDLDDDAQGKRVDVDGDGEEELVLKVDVKKIGSHTETVWDPDAVWVEDDQGLQDGGYKGYNGGGYYEGGYVEKEVDDYAVDGFYVMDYQEGQIDLTYEGPGDQRQGLQSSSTNNLELIDCSILREEDNNNIKSTTKTNWKQDIIRHIIVNPNYVKAAGLNEGDNILAGLALGYGDIDGDSQADWYVDIKSNFSENKNLYWSASHAN